MATNLENKINRIAANVSAALAKVADKGVNVPAGANSDDLASLIGSIELGVKLPTLSSPGSAADLRSGKELIDGEGNAVVGTMPDVAVPTPSVSVSSDGLITATAEQSAGYTPGGTKSGTKQLTVQEAQTITPGTNNITIPSGVYTTGAQTIKGDANLLPENIAEGVSIFGVEGTLIAKPNEYTQIEYIESTGTQYIDTGVVISASTYNKLRIIIDNECTAKGQSYWSVNGCSGGGVVFYVGMNNEAKYVYGNGTGNVPTGVSGTSERQTYDFNTLNKTLKAGTTLNLSNFSLSAPSGNSNFYLFGYNTGVSRECHKEKIYGVKFYENNILIRDYVPCIYKNGDVGLYDVVNDAFYGNAGTGEFLYK